jgi:hypothetical protein
VGRRAGRDHWTLKSKCRSSGEKNPRVYSNKREKKRERERERERERGDLLPHAVLCTKEIHITQALGVGEID